MVGSLKTLVAQSEHSCCRHGDVAEETIEVDNSVDPSSQSTAHEEACSVIVERVDMELGAFPPILVPRVAEISFLCFFRFFFELQKFKISPQVSAHPS